MELISFHNIFFKCMAVFIVILFSNFCITRWNKVPLPVNGDSTLISSVWCSKFRNNSKLCTFKNICYNYYKNIMFFLTNESVIVGLDDKNDFKNIFATSVLGHTGLPLKISIMYNKPIGKRKVYEENVFLLHRFKPDNIMHVIHDDIFPLFVTYRDLCFGDISKCVSKYTLVFSDENTKSSFVDWYRAFSAKEPFQLSRQPRYQTLCFNILQVGLSVESVFYQYGFGKDRGPANLKPGTSSLIKSFRKFMLQYFNVPILNKATSNLAFVSRQKNRKIVNEKLLESSIKKKYRIEYNISVSFMKIDVSVNTSKEMLSAISNSQYLLGMHGSALILAMFLPENSSVLELFPFGIDKESVSHVYIMSLVEGIQFKYFFWQNLNPFHSIPHPEYPAHLGGISHLSFENQLEMLNAVSSKHPASKQCCDDPLFLFRMYQDTWLDESILPVVKSLIARKSYEQFGETHVNQWFFPSFVNNITCVRNISNLSVKWEPPININIHAYVRYNVTIVTYNKNMSLVTNETDIRIILDLRKSDIIQIWIVCSQEGIDSYIVC